jgi:hypothetical protein
MTTKVTIKTKTVTKVSPAQADMPVDGWLGLLSTTSPEIVRVRVFKQRGDNWKPLPRSAEILPPFDIDIYTLFETWGDGTYRFVGVRADGKFAGTKVESCLGFGPDKLGAGSDGKSFEDWLRETIEREKRWAELDAGWERILERRRRIRELQRRP